MENHARGLRKDVAVLASDGGDGGAMEVAAAMVVVDVGVWLARLPRSAPCCSSSTAFSSPPQLLPAALWASWRRVKPACAPSQPAVEPSSPSILLHLFCACVTAIIASYAAIADASASLPRFVRTREWREMRRGEKRGKERGGGCVHINIWGSR